jgi:hypothetical protein
VRESTERRTAESPSREASADFDRRLREADAWATSAPPPVPDRLRSVTPLDAGALSTSATPGNDTATSPGRDGEPRPMVVGPRSWDEEELAVRLQQMGIRLQVRGLSAPSLPPAAAAAPAPTPAAAVRPSRERSFDASSAEFILPRGETRADAPAALPGDRDPSDKGQTADAREAPVEATGERRERDENPSGDSGGSSGQQPQQGQPAGEWVVCFDAATGFSPSMPGFAEAGDALVPEMLAPEEASLTQDLHALTMVDGITVRVGDPTGAWEVDVLRRGTELALTLRGATEVTEQVARDHLALRDGLAREGWRLAQLRIEPEKQLNETEKAVTASHSADASAMNTHSDSHPDARREEAPAWPAPKTPRVQRQPGSVVHILRGRLNREV